MTATVVAAAYVLCMWLVALLFATGMWLTFVIVLQSGSGATMQVRVHMVPSYPSSVQTLYAQCTRLAGWDIHDELFLPCAIGRSPAVPQGELLHTLAASTHVSSILSCRVRSLTVG